MIGRLHRLRFWRDIQAPLAMYERRNGQSRSKSLSQRPVLQHKWSGKQCSVLIGAFVTTTTLWLGYKPRDSQLKAHSREFIGSGYGTVHDYENATSEIRKALNEEAVSTAEETRKAHGNTARSSHETSQLPTAVVYPKTTEDVCTIARICQKNKVPMVAYSGGSSTEGHCSLPYGGITINFTRMDRILDLHGDDMDVVVQPGVNWMDLNNKIKDSGLFFPIDPGPTAMIGGMVATNCSGTHAVRYGTMKDWVINLTVVLADGTVIKTRRRPRKSSAGYNLTTLFVGSEGTLGMVTEATLKLAVIPQVTSVAVTTFPTIHDAAKAAIRIMRAGVPVGAMEIMDEVQMSIINRACKKGHQWKEAPTIFFKFTGTHAGVKDDANIVESLSRASKGRDFEFARTPEEAVALWSARKEALWSMLRLLKDNQRFWGTDVAVPLSRLPDIIEVSKQDMDRLGLFASILGHVGDGNFHANIIYDDCSQEDRAKLEKSMQDMIDRALGMEGTCSGEHGVGLKKKAYLKQELDVETINIMKRIKMALDPQWLMNPGKVFDQHTIDTKEPKQESHTSKAENKTFQGS
ncbi:uncharacterized protein KY384_001076 [Bacidia gigantensis]|uniref:uncharacterized protein n=1 Tax=Bacidia gigantensis TaxID=2732470 RepID=UPI001D04B0FC|nr:uncharacterized protein KY384_001076 [Bacidia gigantensis]KAG8534232.1 hypothetical protein KY384_001076 [Bacidia gigantensis]